MMDGLPTDLSLPAQAVGTGAFGFAAWVLIQLWRAVREWRRERREDDKVQAEREAARQGRQDQGFAALDASRDREIARLNAALDDAARRYEADRRRYEDDLARERQQRHAVEEDRDVGWDKGRAMEDLAHHYRHVCIGLLGQVHAAGRMNLPMPDLLIKIYDAGQAGRPMPVDITPAPVPALQDVPRKPPAG